MSDIDDKKDNLIVEYFKLFDEYTKKFGQNTVIFIEVGKFYEVYATNEKGHNLSELSKILSLTLTTRNSNKIGGVITNPYLIGCPSISIADKVRILTENGYTVVLMEQSSLGKLPKREVTGVYTPGTNIISYNMESNYIISIYIKEEPQLKFTPIPTISLVACDVTTGKIYVCDASTSSDNEKGCFDEAIRFLRTYRPKEILLHNSIKKYTVDVLKSTLDINNIPITVIDTLNVNYTKISYQTEICKKIYPTHGLLHPIEFAGIERMPNVVISFVLLIDFIYSANSKNISHLCVPEIFNSLPILYIGNSATLQLNIFDANTYDTGSKKIKCLLDIVNNTTTPMGKRFLINKLNAPFIEKNALQNIYDVTEEMILDKKYIDYEKQLEFVADIEKIYRKMTIGIVKIEEFNNFVQSATYILEILRSIKQNKKLSEYFMIANKTKKLTKLLDHIKKLFIIQNLKQYVVDKTVPIYNRNIYTHVDSLYDELDIKMNFMEELCEKLSDILGGRTKLKIKKPDKNGYYLCATKKQGDILHEKLKSKTTIKIGKLDIDTKQFVFTHPSANITKISLPEISSHSDDIAALQSQIKDIVKKYFLNDIAEIVSKYNIYIKKIISFTAEFDYIISNAKTSKLFGYTKPTIDEKDYGYINCKQLRHPIIERIIEHEYIPHDICIGKSDLKGMLLYGLNSSGKSSMMKAMGLAIIMAQAGLFVPAKQFIYSPYHSIFTRISGNDNLFKELSSFGVEMVELKAIWKHSDQKTIVIGDEVCRGTEHISGNAIVASTLIKLSQVNSTFIFATHLHDIVTLPQIEKIKNIKSYHLSVTHDVARDELIFDRQLKEGSGENIYGVTVAKFIIRDENFTKMTSEIKKELLGSSDHLIQQHTSKYNSSVYVDSCEICGKKIKYIDGVSTLDTHHINLQKDCVDGVVVGKEHIKKNAKYNLVVLCKKCHNKIHNGEIKIKGITTSSGKRIIQKQLDSEEN